MKSKYFNILITNVIDNMKYGNSYNNEFIIN